MLAGDRLKRSDNLPVYLSTGDPLRGLHHRRMVDVLPDKRSIIIEVNLTV